MVLRMLEVMGLVFTRKSSGSVEETFSSGFWSRRFLASSDAGASTLKAVAVGVSTVVRVATTLPRV